VEQWLALTFPKEADQVAEQALLLQQTITRISKGLKDI
jgi:hypothetical protein